jgi:hypothetical protein
MSAITAVPRNAVRLGLAALGVPARALGSPPLLDRVDASVRDVAGLVLGDDVLRDEAHRKRIAAAAREQAATLARDADEREADAARQERARTEAGAGRSERRKRTAAEAAGRERAAARRRGQAERAAALTEKETALDARVEAQRTAKRAEQLGDAAARAKAARKR